MAFPEPVRRRDVANETEGQVETGMHAGQPGQPTRHDRDAVIAAAARDDLLLLRHAPGVVVVPDQLDLRVVRIRAGVAEEDLRHRNRRAGNEAFGEQRGLVTAHG